MVNMLKKQFVIIALCFLCFGTDVLANEYGDFLEAINQHDDSKAVMVGDGIIVSLENKYKSDATMMLYKSKLSAGEFLTKKMVSQLASAARQKMLIEGGSGQVKTKEISLAPASNFMETAATIFSSPLKGSKFTDEESVFLTKYYNLKMRMFNAEIARAGKSLTIADPDFKELYNYVLVIPLLHLVDDNSSLNIEMFPDWLKTEESLNLLAHSCLWYYSHPKQAMILAQTAAKTASKDFSPIQYYKMAAQKANESQARIAVKCLELATEDVSGGSNIELQMDIAQKWWDSGNYYLSATKSKEIMDKYPDYSDFGKVVNQYFYSLAKNGDEKTILSSVDEYINDTRCELYIPKLMYIKWWALRRDRQQLEKLTVLEHDMLEKYGSQPLVAPIMLSKATDFLAQQDYSAALALLEDLVKKFPETQAAEQAKKISEKLKNISN